MAETKDEAGTLDIFVERGATFSRNLAFTQDDVGIDFTSDTGRAQVRRKGSASEELINLTNGSGLTMNDGSIDMVFSAAQTKALEEDEYVWGLETETAGGVVTPRLKGRFVVGSKLPRD